MTLHPLDVLYRQGMQKLMDGQLKQFLTEKESRAVSHAEQRVFLHLRVKEMQMKGEYYQAIEAIQRCFHEKGEHLGLWCDLATCYYLTQQYGLWGVTLQKIETLLRDLKDSMTSASLAKTRVMLAKFFEEKGDLQKALSYWTECLDTSEIETLLRARINIVRLLALYPLGPELSLYYRDLKTALRSKLGLNLEIEVLHALALAEIALLGPSVWPEVQRLISKYEVGEEDRSLIYFDVADLMLRTGEKLPTDLVAIVKTLLPVGPFEEALQAIALGEKSESIPWLTLATQMPVGNFLRLTSLALHLDKVESSEQLTLQREVELTLLGFNPKDRQIWQSLMPVGQKDDLRIELSSDKKLVINGRYHLNLASKKKIFQLLQELSVHPEASFEDLTVKVYEAEYNDSYFHRLRRLVKRFNDEVLAVGAPALLEIRDGKICVLARIDGPVISE